ncbi:MAG: murein transglycosylase domain-containing protein [Candidatus Marinimicrobia bacterium]|nr:murein transglycosylase domain-containing protein [Candidatus Neomarinimicrobiota bacterium]
MKSKITVNSFIMFFVMTILILFVNNSFAQDSFEEYKRSQEKQFKKYVIADKKAYEDYVKADKEAFENFKKDMERKWGDFVTSTKKDWVEYSNDNNTRTAVDFKNSNAKVEILIPIKNAGNNKLVKEKLLEAVKELALTKGKTKDYDIPKEKAIPLSRKPILKDQLQMKNGETVNENNIEKYSEEIINTSEIKKTEVKTNEIKNPKKKGDAPFESEQPEFLRYSISLELAPDNIQKRAEQYLPIVKKYSTYYDLPIDLVFAMIHTESFYNPKARSYIPAYGLMQLVPRTAAHEAYEYIYDKKKMLPANYLYDPNNNIELGTAYLYKLKTHYFKNIHNRKSKNYCIIAAYNTGSGNVNKTFGSLNLQNTAKIINTMKPEEVYQKLRIDLPYEETRKYMKKVNDRREKYQSWGM